VIVDRVPAARHRNARRIGTVEIVVPRRWLEIVRECSVYYGQRYKGALGG
jgi:hypothetical protein